MSKYSGNDFADDIIELCVKLKMIPEPKPTLPPGVAWDLGIDEDDSENESEAHALKAITDLHKEVVRLRAFEAKTLAAIAQLPQAV